MTKDEHNKILNDLKACTSDADRMALILKLDQDYTGILTERDTAVTQAQTAEAEASKWAKLNNQLWLENSNQKKAGQATQTETETGTGTEEPPKKRSYEDLEKEF
jgi:sRNA-binding protein